MVVTSLHCHYCFDVLLSHFDDAPHIIPEFEDASYPLFVTWNITRNSSTRLRGCIGNFQALPLHEGLKEYALTSALHDRRFSPITRKEIKYLSCSVSLLTDFEDAKSYLDWDLGIHGIIITFHDPFSGRIRSATYLPDVAPSQGWSKLETIDSLIQKAGHYGEVTEEVRMALQVRKYKGNKYEVSWEEFVAWKESTTNKTKSREMRISMRKRQYVDGYTDVDEEDMIDHEQLSGSSSSADGDESDEDYIGQKKELIKNHGRLNGKCPRT